MGLHGDMGVEVVQRAICLLTTVPSTLVHALNLLISATWTLVLLGSWNWNEGVNLRKWMLLAEKEISDWSHDYLRLAGARQETRDVKHRATHSAQVQSLKDVLAKASEAHCIKQCAPLVCDVKVSTRFCHVLTRRVEVLRGWNDYIPVLDHEGLEQQKLGRRRHMVVAYAERADCKHPILDDVAARTLDLDAGDNRGPFRAAVVDSYTAAVLVEGTLG